MKHQCRGAGAHDAASLRQHFIRTQNGDRHDGKARLGGEVEWSLLEWEQAAVARASAFGIDSHVDVVAHDFARPADALDGSFAIATLDRNDLGEIERLGQDWNAPDLALCQN